MEREHNDSQQRHARGSDGDNPGVINEISGGHIAGNVAQFGDVSGDLNIGSPESSDDAEGRRALGNAETPERAGAKSARTALLLFAAALLISLVLLIAIQAP